MTACSPSCTARGPPQPRCYDDTRPRERPGAPLQGRPGLPIHNPIDVRVLGTPVRQPEQGMNPKRETLPCSKEVAVSILPDPVPAVGDLAPPSPTDEASAAARIAALVDPPAHCPGCLAERGERWP